MRELFLDCERSYGKRVCFAELTQALKHNNPVIPSRLPGLDHNSMSISHHAFPNRTNTENWILPFPSPRHHCAGRIRVLASGASHLITWFRLYTWQRGPTPGAASILWLNVWGRMVMSDTPFTTALCDQHGEARRPRHRLAVLHPGKFVKAGDQNSVVTKHNGVPFLDDILVAAVL